LDCRPKGDGSADFRVYSIFMAMVEGIRSTGTGPNMAVIETFARRIGQLHLLFSAPPELRREHERHQIEAVLEIAIDGQDACTYRSTDISHGGVFVEPSIPLEVGGEVKVSVGDLLRSAPATVVAHRSNGTAMRFCSVVHGAALTAWLVNHPSGRLRH